MNLIVSTGAKLQEITGIKLQVPALEKKGEKPLNEFYHKLTKRKPPYNAGATNE